MTYFLVIFGFSPSRGGLISPNYIEGAFSFGKTPMVEIKETAFKLNL